MKRGESRSGSTELVMMPMPVNKRPKPIMIWPMFRFLGALMNTYRMAPAKATRGAKVSGLQNSIQVLPPDISDRRISWPVTVVPMFAPMMMPMP